MSYAETERRLRSGGIIILDGGTGTELQRRGVPMDPEGIVRGKCTGAGKR